MNSIKSMISSFAYVQLERFISIAYDGGENATFLGMPCFNDEENFVLGKTVESSISLVVHYYKTGDTEMMEKSRQKLIHFLNMAVKNEMRSWGKFSVLRGLDDLKEAGLLNLVDEKYLKILREKTDYDDIIDKKTLNLCGYNTNYYHVAMACAGLRCKLGWEDITMAEKIAQKFYDTFDGYSTYGWMDENFPYGRFDRYSMLIASEITDTLHRLGLPVPQMIKEKLRTAAQAILKMINNRGDGICYGRSLSTHGDSAVAEILSSALTCNLIDQTDIDKAVWYSIITTQKLFDFWYDKELDSFNIWLNGRATNQYRQIHRILEVNLDMTGHLLNTLHNFEMAGFEEYIPQYTYVEPDKWQMECIDFDNQEYVRKAFILKRDNYMFTLPLIGCGGYMHWSAYLPFPVCNGVIEAPPEYFLPFLTPIITFEDGTTAMPVQYFDNIDTVQENDKISITAHLKTLACADESFPTPVEATECTSVYTFEKNSIGALFNIKTDKKIESIQMEFAFSGKIDAEAVGMKKVAEENVSDNSNYFTPHGRCEKLIKWKTDENTCVGYKILLN